MSAYELYLALQKQAAEDSADRPYLAGAAAGSALGGFTGAMHGLLGREEAGLAAVSQAEHQDYRNLRAANRALITKGTQVIDADSVGKLSELLQEQYRKHPAHAKFRAAANAHVGSRAGIGAALGLGTGLALAHFAGRDKQAAEGDEQSSGGHPYLLGIGGGLAGGAAGAVGGAAVAERRPELKNMFARVEELRGAGGSLRGIAGNLSLEFPEELKALRRRLNAGAGIGAAAGIAAGLGANYLLAGRDKRAAVAQLPVEIEHPYEFAAQGVGEAALPGLGWGAGIGAVGGLALGRTPLSTLGGAAVGGLLGAAVTGSAREAENWNRHAALVRAYEAQHGTLPYELSRPREAERMARMRGQLVGAAADVALSGGGGLTNDRRSTYGIGTMIGGRYGSASAREQFERALIAHKRQMEKGAGIFSGIRDAAKRMGRAAQGVVNKIKPSMPDAERDALSRQIAEQLSSGNVPTKSFGLRRGPGFDKGV